MSYRSVLFCKDANCPVVAAEAKLCLGAAPDHIAVRSLAGVCSDLE